MVALLLFLFIIFLQALLTALDCVENRVQIPYLSTFKEPRNRFPVWWVCATNRFVVPARQAGNRFMGSLKVLTNEKRGGLAVVSLDRSGFKLFSL
jgi:hypothetical protein